MVILSFWFVFNQKVIILCDKYQEEEFFPILKLTLVKIRLLIMPGDNFIVLAGGPGSGKSTAIAQLHLAGYLTVSEAGREIIKEQVGLKSDALPWKDRARFCEMVFAKSIQAYSNIKETRQTVFFDRGIPDLIAYSRFINKPPADEWWQASRQYSYCKSVFIFPFWKDIYCADNERKETCEQAALAGKLIKEVYEELGYQTIEVPKADPLSRIYFILESLQKV